VWWWGFSGAGVGGGGARGGGGWGLGIVLEVYSGSNLTTSLASSAGNFSDPRLMTQVVRVEQCV
jgi:hypothetical protein